MIEKKLRNSTLRFIILGCLAVSLVFDLWVSEAVAVKVTLKDGRVLSGAMGRADGVAEDPDNPPPAAGGVDVQRLLVFDDGLKRTFVSVRQLAPEAPTPETENLERILVRQNVAKSGAVMGMVGPILEITPFDKYGRRTFRMRTDKGPRSIVQGITEITPHYTTVEGIAIGGRSVQWKMKIATSSIPRETLSEILDWSIQQAGGDDPLAAVRLYLQSERYEDAAEELRRVAKQRPELPHLKAQERELTQLSARRRLDEIQLRAKAGQHQLAIGALKTFPSENVAGATLQHVRQILAEYETKQRRIDNLLAQFDRLMEELKYDGDQSRLLKIREEIGRELNFNSLPRLAAFEQHMADQELTAQLRLATGVSGWLLGSDHALENLSTALSLVDVREQVQLYMRAKTRIDRQEILDRLKTMEGATVVQVSRLLYQMAPPMADPDLLTSGMPNDILQRTFPNINNEPDVVYNVLLPPEYDPHRKYPTIVTLNGAGSTPEMQIDWWAGERTEQGLRKGQATRHGYITIAVEWQKPNQKQYGYSAREHHAVLGSLRDACRQFSIDTDRVFLTGHSIGGNAAWDMALAHPDLWAGFIPIVATADMYCSLYKENAKLVPSYFVGGERDGNKMKQNASELDHYLRRGYNATVVEFLGRGHENFHDEILALFDWMGRHQRDFFPKEFKCSTMRPWDNFYWWAELSNPPAKTVVLPSEWNRKRVRRPLVVEGKIKPNGGLYLKTGSGGVTLWLSPELVDFDKRIQISSPGRRPGLRRDFVEPNLEVLLEDVRTRGDRQHPFWAKVVF